MLKISIKIAYPIILAGVFVIIAFIGFNYENLNINFFVIFLFLIIYIFLFGFATGQNFAVPFKKILQGADDLAKGDLKSRIYIKSNDELGQLAIIFNQIAEDLEQSKSETETTGKSVDIKVKARTQALEEIINALEQKIKNRTLELQRVSDELEKFRRHPKLKESEVIMTKKNPKDSKKESIESEVEEV